MCVCVMVICYVHNMLLLGYGCRGVGTSPGVLPLCVLSVPVLGTGRSHDHPSFGPAGSGEAA